MNRWVVIVNNQASKQNTHAVYNTIIEKKPLPFLFFCLVCIDLSCRQHDNNIIFLQSGFWLFISHEKFPCGDMTKRVSEASVDESSLFSRQKDDDNDDDVEEESSWNGGCDDDNDDEEDNFDDENKEKKGQYPQSSSPFRSRGLSFSEHQQQIDSESIESIRGGPRSSSSSSSSPYSPNHQRAQQSNNAAAAVPTEQERQILLLMLLAQVCALHDPTPRTFTVHVLELFERGILDRQSIHFLFELGLVPSLNTSSKLLTAAAPSSSPSQNKDTKDHNATTQLIASQGMQQQQRQQHYQLQRSLEVSAIRSTLEQQESITVEDLSPTSHPAAHSPTNTTNAAAAATHSNPPSWSAEHHPLSLSRYQREFDQVGLLSSGSFGQVFQATNKTDGQDYAIKRVPFNATGYSKDSVQQVTREVQCLAACDHPNVVRYYTSWLEPSWMTGSGGKATVIPTKRQTTKLLMDGAAALSSSASSSSSSSASSSSDSDERLETSDDLLDYFRNPKFHPNLSRRNRQRQRRRFSFDNSDRSASWRPVVEDDHDDDDGESSEEDIFDFGRRSHRIPTSDDESDIFDRSSHNNNHTTEEQSTRDDSYLDDLFGRGGKGKKKKSKQQRQPTYRYQICLFIQMQLCHPSTLADWIRARNRQMEDSTLTERLRPALQIFEQICSGLSHVHHKKIVHRDLKPANIFASQDGSSFLIGDFGLSKLLQAQNRSMVARKRQYQEDRLLLMYELCNNDNSIVKEDTKKSASVDEPSWRDPLTAGVGTASYASPEQVTSKTYGKEADIFSVGLILLELLCCFCTEHERIQTFHDCRYRRDLPEDIRQIPSLAKTILQCTDKNPENRPSAESLRKFALMSLSAESSSLGSFGDLDEEEPEVERLKRQLAEKEKEVNDLKALLAEKDRSIDDLQEQVSSLRMAAIRQRSGSFQSSQVGAVFSPRYQSTDGGDSSSSRGSSSEDEL